MKWSDVDPVAVRWVQLNDRFQELLVVSEFQFWTSHWDPRARRTIRCGGKGCYLCTVGAQKQLRCVIQCVDARGRDVLLELRERHRVVFEQIDRVVGTRIKVRKTGTANNAPVEVKECGSAYAIERDISHLVASFGLRPIMISEEVQAGLPELLPAPSESTETRFE